MDIERQIFPDLFPVQSSPDKISKTDEYPKLQYEPGIHSAGGQKEINKLYESFFSGNLNAHFWNPQIAERIMTYQPKVLTIDSQVPLLTDNSSLEITAEDKYRFWMLMPARPTKINATGEIYTVSGDFTYTENSNLFPSNLEKVLQKNWNGDSLLLNEDMVRLENDEYIRSFLIDTVNAKGPVGASLLINSVLLLAGYLDQRRANQLSPDKVIKRYEETATFSRRRFLAAAGYFLLGLGVSRISSPYFAAISSRTDTEKFFTEISSIMRPRLLLDGWANARTAILISKLEDAIDYLHFPKNIPGSVIMGNGHIFDADQLMESIQLRDKVTNDFCVHLLNIIDAILVHLNAGHLGKMMHNQVLDYITKVDIIKITDPGGPDVNPAIANLVGKSVTPVAEFQSTKVESAIGKLR